MTAFQNCGKFEATTAISSSGNTIDNGGAATPGGGNPNAPPTTTPPVVNPPVVNPPIGPSETVLRQQRCYALLANPVITSLASTAVTIQHGQTNRADEGNMSAAPIAVVTTRGVANQAAYDADNCVTQQTLRIQCAVVTDDLAKKAVITNAVSTSGADRLAELRAANLAANPNKPAAQIAQEAQDQIAMGTYNNNNCQATFGQGNLTANIAINSAYQVNDTGFRCVEGSFWVRINVRSELADINPDHDSAFSYIKVTVNNGCWKEHRLNSSISPRVPDVANIGSDVAINGDWAAAMAESENNEPRTKVGAIYMFKKESGSWGFKHKIILADTVSREPIQSVVMQGDNMFIGVPQKGNKGSVYLFRRSNDTWSQVGASYSEATLPAAALFGRSLAITATQIFVGAPGAGQVYAYQYDNAGIKANTMVRWTGTNKFGTSIAVSGTNLAVGAPGAGAPIGSVFVYNTVTSAELKSLTGTDAGEQFGSKVAIRGNRLAVTSGYYYTAANPQVGRVTFFEDFNSGTVTKTFEGQNPSAILGQGLALGADGIYIGTPQVTGNIGIVIYQKYTEMANAANSYRLHALNESGNAAFGYSIAVDNGNVIIGARTRNDPGDNNGAAYIFELK